MTTQPPHLAPKKGGLPFFLAVCGVWGGAIQAEAEVHRVGRLAKIRPDRVEALEQVLADNQDGVARVLNEFQIRNYSIYVKELEPGQPYLFNFFEYTGDDYAAAQATMKEDARVAGWADRVWAECLEKTSPDAESYWTNMDEVFYFAGRGDVHVVDSKVKRFGMVIGVRPEMVEGYKQLHAHPWQGILDKIREGNLRNYPIYMTTLGEKVYIFGYFEYVGDDFDADMKEIDSDPVTIAWMKFTDKACQLPLETRKEGEWWADMQRVFYQR